MSGSSIKVALVDDHAVVRESLARMIDSDDQFTVVGQAGSLSEARSVLAVNPVNVVVVDVSLPDGNGLSLVRAMRESSDTVGIVVLTMHDDDETLLGALDAGASALVLKSAPADDVVNAIARAASSPDVFSAAGLAAALRRKPEPKGAVLTQREQEVLHRLLDGESIDQIAQTLFISRSTVKTHVSKLYDKLGVHNRAALAMEAVRLGLVAKS